MSFSHAAPSRRLYVGRVGQDAQRADLEDLFSSFGAKPADVKLLNGFGFVEYDSVNDAEDAIKELDGRDFMGDRLMVQFAKSSGERRPQRFDDRYGGDRDRDRYPPPGRGGPRDKPSQGWRLTISNLPNGCSWQDLKDFARTAGNVHYAEVSRQDPSEGIIEYMSHSDAEGALKTLDGVEMRGSVVRVVEGAAAPGQTWADPRASPPPRSRDYGSRRDDDRDYRRRDRSRSRSPGYSRRGDRDDRDRRPRDDYDDRRAPPPRRDRSRSPRGESRRSPRYDRD